MGNMGCFKIEVVSKGGGNGQEKMAALDSKVAGLREWKLGKGGYIHSSKADILRCIWMAQRGGQGTEAECQAPL